jgi:hypothetical protein
VDLNDSSTFQSESQADLQPHIIRVRPALSGDLSALPNNALLQQGYPPRPDPNKNAGGYARWVQAVTKPVDVFDAILVSRLAPRFGSYEGTSTCVWTGFVQSADTFASLGCGIVMNYTGTLYEEYAVTMAAPSGNCCCSGGCQTGIWGGIGGTPINGLGNTQLIQSGFMMFSVNAGSVPGVPFVEYTPAGPKTVMLPGGDRFSVGDTFLVWGWSSSVSNCWTADASGKHGCFGFEDESNNWNFNSAFSGSMIQPQIAGGTFFPATAEYIAEVAGRSNANYGYDYMYGDAWDSTGTEHPDPGATGGTDPYIYMQQDDPSGYPYSTATWYSDLISFPEDPMFVFYQNAN